MKNRRGANVAKNIKCFYHDDLDGICSANIVKMKYPNAQCFQIDYESGFPWDTIKSTDFVFMVDYSLSPFSEMEKLNGMCNFIWIDHHKSSLDGAKKSDVKIEGLQLDGQAGCELTWQYIFPNKPIPTYVKLLADFDVWRNENEQKWDNEIEPFQFGMQAVAQDQVVPGGSIWQQLASARDDDLVYQTITSGKCILQFLKKQYAEVCDKYAFEVDIDGKKAIVLNTPNRGSQNLQSVYDESKHDFMIVYRWTGEEFTFSIYSTKDDCDCSAVAKKYGGGGHLGAAGMTNPTLPWS